MDPDRNRETDGGGPQRYLVTALVMGSGIGFVFALVFYSVLWLSGDAVAAAEVTLAHIAAGEMSLAYEESAPELRHRQSLTAFDASMTALGLKKHDAVDWTDRTVDHRGARLVGDVTTAQGGQLSVTVTVIRRRDDWRVASIMRTPTREPGEKRR